MYHIIPDILPVPGLKISNPAIRVRIPSGTWDFSTQNYAYKRHKCINVKLRSSFHVAYFVDESNQDVYHIYSIDVTGIRQNAL